MLLVFLCSEQLLDGNIGSMRLQQTALNETLLNIFIRSQYVPTVIIPVAKPLNAASVQATRMESTNAKPCIVPASSRQDNPMSNP